MDSHVALWWLESNERLGEIAHGELLDAGEVFFSPVTPWELGIKRALGKLAFPFDLASALADSGFTELPISSEHAMVAAGLPPHHRDPFNRMLIAQAQVEDLMFVTADRNAGSYDVEVLDAGL